MSAADGSLGARNVFASVSVLTQIWEQVLQRGPIRPDEDFFDLGGNIPQAVFLLDEVERRTGLRLPLTALPGALTVASMTKLIGRSPAAASPLAMIRIGAKWEPPVFLTHGAGGCVLEAYPIGRQIRWSGTIYGIQADGLHGVGPPRLHIEDMAQFACDAILTRQPRGPYYLVGISSGGLVMLETALRLLARNERVGLLAFVDTYPHPKRWPVSCWIDHVFHRSKRYAAMLRELSLNESIPQVLSLPMKIARHLRYRAGEPLRIGSESDACTPAGLNQLQTAYALAIAGYRPRPFPGVVRFLKAAVHTSFPNNPTAVWGAIGQRLDIEQIACEHVQMITTHSAETADWISRCLDQA